MAISASRTSTVVTPSASYALVDLATVKDELTIKTNDTTKDGSLIRNIAFVSTIISNYCSAPFAPFVVEALSDVFQFERDSFPGIRFAGENRIALSRCPVLQVTSVSQALPNGTTLAMVLGTDYQINLKNGELTRLDSSGRAIRWEPYPLTVNYFAGYGALITGEAAQVSAAVPHQAVAANAATFAFDQGVTYSTGKAMAYVAANPALGQYTVNSSGIYSFAAADQGASVLLSYASNIIPPDLVSHCLEIITARWLSRGRDPALVQRETPGVGIERFWFGSHPGQDGELPPHIQASLDNSYRSPRIA